MNNTDQVLYYREWKRSNPEYPLTVHSSGQWVKKVRGRTHYFGPLSDPEAALRRWSADRHYLLIGINPQPSRPKSVTIKELFARHLADVDARIHAERMSAASRRDYTAVHRVFRAAMMDGLPVSLLAPEHFAEIQVCIERSGLRLRTQRNLIAATRAIFNWGRKMELIKKPVRYGPRFASPPLYEIEADQETNGVCRFIDRDVILSALDMAKPRLKVAILLGINCGFYPGDAIAMTLDKLHLDGEIPYHDMRRVKTKRRRMAAFWPETVAAIADYRDNHRRLAKRDERILLLSTGGRPYSPKQNGDKLRKSFGAILDRLSARERGVNLGSLRHTYATVVDLVPDQAMIDLTMGHVGKSLQKRVYKQLNIRELPRLKVVANTVREWLYG